MRFLIGSLVLALASTLSLRVGAAPDAATKLAAKPADSTKPAPKPAPKPDPTPAKPPKPAKPTPPTPPAPSPAKPSPAKPAPHPASDGARPAAPGQGTGWHIIESHGIAYVDFMEAAAVLGFTKVKRDGHRIFLSKGDVEHPESYVEWRTAAGQKLISLNNISIYLSYNIVEGKDGKLLLSAFDFGRVLHPIIKNDELRDPSHLKVVVIDAARGGEEDGIVTKFGKEKDVTLDIANRLKSRLERAGLKVFMTRETDLKLDDQERVLLANSQHEEAIFLSLRCSYGSAAGDQGIETFTLSPSCTPSTTGDEGHAPDQKFYPGNINDRESMALATALQGTVIYDLKDLKAKDLGIRRARFAELKGVAMPAVVCSVGRLAHPDEGKRLGTDPTYRERIAAALCDGIVNRYAPAMAAPAKTRGSPPVPKALKFAKVESFPDKVKSLTGEQVRIRASVAKTDVNAVIDPAKVTLQMYFLDIVNGEEIDLSSCDTPKATWLSALPSWQDAHYEEVEFTYRQPPVDESLVKTLGLRTYYGYVLRLVYGDELMDEYAEPANVKRGLATFTAVAPRRR